MSLSVDERPRTHLFRNALRRRWLLAIGSAMAIGALAAALVIHSKPHYVASASVFLQPITGNALSPDATVNGQQVTVAMETEAGLVNSPDVVRRVEHVLDVPARDLRAGVTATVPMNTKIVQIQYQAATPEAARRGAEAFARSYLHFREALASGAQNRQMDKLRAQVADANKSLHALAARGGSSAAARRQVLVSRLATLQATIGQLDATDVHPGTVSSPARTPTAPAGIPPNYLIAAGILFGLVVGLVIAVGREAIDDTIRDTSDLELASLPVLSELQQRPGGGPALLGEDPVGAVVETYRQLRVGISATVPQARTICVCDVESPGDAGIHALNLAVVMAGAGLGVAVVDATGTGSVIDLVGGQLVGDERSDAGAQLHTGGKQPVTVISASDDDGQLTYVDEDRLALQLLELRGTAHHVLVAAPSLLTSDGEVAGLASDCVLLVVEQNKTRMRDIEKLARRAAVLGISFCGIFSVPSRRRTGRAVRQGAETAMAPNGSRAESRVYRLLGNLRLGQADSGS